MYFCKTYIYRATPELIFHKPMAAVKSARYVPVPVRISAFYPLVLTFFLMASLHGTMPAQQADRSLVTELEDLIEESYGPDQHLINGIEYINLHIRTQGHKFLDEDTYYKGRIVIDHRTYRDVLIKYDIFGQRVLLLIEHSTGGNKQIVLNNLRIVEFEINNRLFRKYTFPGKGTRFYHVIGNEEMACLYYYSKQEISRPIDNNTLSELTDTKKKTYLYRRPELHAFRSNRSFVRLFPDHESRIKAYFREHRLSVRKLNDIQMSRLVGYLQSITKTASQE